MDRYTPHQARYFAEQIMLKRPQASMMDMRQQCQALSRPKSPTVVRRYLH
jgi:hypothetical protein